MPDPFEFFKFMGLSDEERAEQKIKADKFKMEVEDFQHGFQRLFEELDHDQLSTLKTMLQFIMASESKEMVISLEAMIRWELKTRFGICATCGEDHTVDLPESNEGDVPLFSIEEAINNGWVSPESPSEALLKAQPHEDIPLPFELTDQDRKDMETYHLDDLYEEGTNTFLGFVCTGIEGMKSGCGLRYPTIEDRKLRGPEECSGCFSRQAHG